MPRIFEYKHTFLNCLIVTGTKFEYGNPDVKFINRPGLNVMSLGCAPPPSYPPLDTSVENYVIWLFNGKPLRRDVTPERVIKGKITMI